ncbi:hypothetical protein [Dactylosporangium sp. CA-139066]|uniref:hypothetical protein n=1 Tax=Dactylosporangium sp. CA-139066 TaxID=3239930 RepID=UPI003D915FBE
MAYATVAEMAKLRPGGIDAEDEDRAEALLDEASQLVDEATGTTWVAPATPPRAVKSVVIQVALRVFDNPNEVSGEQLGAYSYQKPQDRVTGLELSKSERRRVLAAVGKVTAGSVRAPLGYDVTSLAGLTAIGDGGDPL